MSASDLQPIESLLVGLSSSLRPCTQELRKSGKGSVLREEDCKHSYRRSKCRIRLHHRIHTPPLKRQQQRCEGCTKY
jgi:hypothetical protein